MKPYKEMINFPEMRKFERKVTTILKTFLPQKLFHKRLPFTEELGKQYIQNFKNPIFSCKHQHEDSCKIHVIRRQAGIVQKCYKFYFIIHLIQTILTQRKLIRELKREKNPKKKFLIFFKLQKILIKNWLGQIGYIIGNAGGSVFGFCFMFDKKWWKNNPYFYTRLCCAIIAQSIMFEHRSRWSFYATYAFQRYLHSFPRYMKKQGLWYSWKYLENVILGFSIGVICKSYFERDGVIRKLNKIVFRGLIAGDKGEGDRILKSDLKKVGKNGEKILGGNIDGKNDKVKDFKNEKVIIGNGDVEQAIEAKISEQQYVQ